MKRPIFRTVIMLVVSTWVIWAAIHDMLGWGEYVFMAAVFLQVSLSPVLDELEKRRRGRVLIALIKSSPLYRRQSNGR
jgi:predicted PurR-regulated permease PerM